MIAVAAPSAFTAVSLSLLTTATSTFLIAVLTTTKPFFGPGTEPLINNKLFSGSTATTSKF